MGNIGSIFLLLDRNIKTEHTPKMMNTISKCKV